MKPGNYLRDALDTGLVRIRTLSQVTGVIFSKSTKLYTIEVTELLPNGSINRTYEIVTPKVFMAAGSVHTTALLVRASLNGDLPDLNVEVGRHWGNNADLFSLRDSGVSTNIGQGAPASFGIFANEVQDGVTVMDIPASWATNTNNGRSTAQLIMGNLHGERGILTYDKTSDTVTINFPTNPRPDAKAYSSAQAVFALLNRDNPGSSGTLPPIEQAAAVTGHPLGGVVYLRATDYACRALGYKNLYIVDSSLVPGFAGAVNPAFTVAALAEQCLDFILASNDFAADSVSMGSTVFALSSLILTVLLSILSF